MTLETDKDSQTRIVKIEGRPNSPERPREQTRWESFKFFLLPNLKKSKEFAEAYAEARLEKERSEARKTTEEAAEIAARKDLMAQEEVKLFNNIIDDIFEDNDLSPFAKALKLAKLMEKNPQIVAQLDKIKEVIEELFLNKGFNIEVDVDSMNFLPEEDFKTREETIADLTDEVSEKETTDEAFTLISMPIKELELSVRALTCLESAKIETVGQLVSLTEIDLLKIRGFAKTTLREVRRKLAGIGLSLRLSD